MRGPIIPAMFICRPPSVLAEAKCSGGTISTSTEADAGEAKANPIPNRKTLIRMTDGLRESVSARMARQSAIEACHSARPIKNLLALGHVGERPCWQGEQRERKGREG